MRFVRPLLLVVVASIILAGCTDSPAPAPTTSASTANDACANESRQGLTLSNDSHAVVAINTEKGCIVVELYESKAPITTTNFKRLIEDGFYKDILFHRIIKNFMVQTGGMQTNGQFKESPYPPIKNEARTSGLKNLEYTLSMARTNQPDSATNQFFINTSNNCNLDPQSNSSCPDRAGPDGYAVFGIVVKGRDVVDQIENTPTTFYNAPGANPHCQQEQGSPSCPARDVVLRSMRIL